MIIRDSFMLRKMQRALLIGGNLFTLEDIARELREGYMQGHVIGDTWAVTRVHDYPQKRAVEIMFVVGNLEESLALEKKITEWAQGLGAGLITATGREGWWKYRTEGWKITGTNYAKDI